MDLVTRPAIPNAHASGTFGTEVSRAGAGQGMVYISVTRCIGFGRSADSLSASLSRSAYPIVSDTAGVTCTRGANEIEDGKILNPEPASPPVQFFSLITATRCNKLHPNAQIPRSGLASSSLMDRPEWKRTICPRWHAALSDTIRHYPTHTRTHLINISRV